MRQHPIPVPGTHGSMFVFNTGFRIIAVELGAVVMVAASVMEKGDGGIKF